ncbi:MAG: hypothetical protein ACOYK8_00505 [Alphaproteobacteria bacterium]
MVSLRGAFSLLKSFNQVASILKMDYVPLDGWSIEQTFPKHNSEPVATDRVCRFFENKQDARDAVEDMRHNGIKSATIELSDNKKNAYVYANKQEFQTAYPQIRVYEGVEKKPPSITPALAPKSLKFLAI